MWALKILIKIFLKRLPFDYFFWKKVGIFKHGEMEDIIYSQKIFFPHIEAMQSINKCKNPIIIELGPGDSITSAILAKLYQARKIYLIDIGSFARKDVNFYKNYIQNLLQNNPDLAIDPCQFNNFEDLKNLCKAEYLTNGLSSFKTIESGTIDYIFSHSVMEHIRLKDLENIIAEMYRVLKNETGVMSHNINYKDHLEDSLNNLRFPRKIWESDFFADSGFYTNRVPALEMHKYFKEAGFKLYNENFGRWPKMPISRKFISKEFKRFSDSQLMNITSSFLSKK